MIRLEWVWRLVAIGSLVCIGCAASPSRLSSPAQGGAKWTRVDTANFRVFTDLEPEEARHIALQLERDLDALGQAAFESVRPVVEHTDVPNEPRFLWSQLRLEIIRRQGRLQPSELNALLPKFERLASLAKSSQQLLIAAVYHQARGNSEQALTLAQRAVKLDPIDPLVLDNYATVLDGAGLWKDALEVQRRALAFVSDGEQEQRKALREHLEALEARAK